MVQKFKMRWQIKYNWQLLFPFLGIIGLCFSAHRLSWLILDNYSSLIKIGFAILLYFILLRITLFIFKKLETKWIVTYRWEMIRIFLVFAITGSSSMFISKPFMIWLGITKENLNNLIYWFFFISIGLVIYQILLVSFGWLFGQFQFFWDFEKKMLRKIGIKL